MKKVLNILLLALVTIVLSVSCSQEVTVDSNFYENNETGTFTVDGRGFATLQDAIDYVRGSRAINDSNTIKLTKNASGPGANVDGSLELCIDFQGYTFSFTNVTGKQGENVSDKSFGLSITDGATVSLKGLQEISLYDSTTNLTMVYVEGSDTSLTIEDSPKMVVEDDQYVFWAANGATLTIGSDSATDTEAFISGKIAATGTTEKKPTVAIKSKTTITGTIQATSANVALYGSSSVAGAIEASASSISINQTSKINASLSAKDASVVVVNTSNSDAGTITTMDKDGGSTVVVSGGTVKIDEIAEGSDTQVEVGGGGTVTSSEITRRDASYVAIIENKLYETLQGAVDAAKAGDTVVLLKDIDLTNYSRGSFGNGFDLSNITLDLNGFKITSNNAGVYYYGTNATIKNGTFVANPNAGNEYYDSYALFLGGRQRALTDTRNSITVENVICYGGINASHPAGIDATIKNSTVYATRYYTVCSQGTGSIVTIEGGTFERKNTDGNKTTPIEGNALFYVSNNSYDGYDDRLIIKSGTFTQASGELLEVFSNTEHTSVLGGVFNVDPSAYVANGYMVNSSTSTTWTVDESVYWIDYSTTAFAGGTGSSEDPYQIETAEQLALVAKLVNHSNTNEQYRNAVYKITSDINLSGKIWTPIGYGNTFSGTIYAGTLDDSTSHKTITGLSNKSGNYSFLPDERSDTKVYGLVGTIKNTSNSADLSVNIQNIYLSDVNIDTTGDIQCKATGVLVGNVLANSDNNITSLVLKNIQVSGSITGNYHTGGIIGRMDENTKNFTAESCINNASVTGVNHSDRGCGFVGGVLGYSNATGAINFTNCTNTGAITSPKYTGGLLAEGTGTITFSGCTNSGAVTANGGDANYTYAGGLLGTILTTSNPLTFVNCSNTGNVNSTGKAGGFTAGNYGSGGFNGDIVFSGTLSSTGTVIGAEGYYGSVIGCHADKADVAVSEVTDISHVSKIITNLNGATLTFANKVDRGNKDFTVSINVTNVE